MCSVYGIARKMAHPLYSIYSITMSFRADLVQNKNKHHAFQGAHTTKVAVLENISSGSFHK